MVEIINGVVPDVENAAYIAPNAVVVGDVTLAEGTSVWYGAVIRCDGGCHITIGKNSNIQDNVTLHASDDQNIVIGEDVTVGHNAIVHCCQLGNRVLVGMHATVLDGAKIGDDCLIGAGALVTGGTVIPAGSLVLGAPAKVVRPLTEKQLKSLRLAAQEYVEQAAIYSGS